MKKIIVSQTVDSLISEQISNIPLPNRYLLDYLCVLRFHGVSRIKTVMTVLDSGSVVFDYQCGKAA